MNVPEAKIREWQTEYRNLALSAALSQQPAPVSEASHVAWRSAEFATAQERERCAKLCDETASVHDGSGDYSQTMRKSAYSLAARIRALPNGDSNEAN